MLWLVTRFVTWFVVDGAFLDRLLTAVGPLFSAAILRIATLYTRIIRGRGAMPTRRACPHAIHFLRPFLPGFICWVSRHLVVVGDRWRATSAVVIYTILVLLLLLQGAFVPGKEEY